MRRSPLSGSADKSALACLVAKEAVAPEPGPYQALYMSTNAIKTELVTLLRHLRPAKGWQKRVTVNDLAAFAVHEFPDGTTDRLERRALELAWVIHGHERR
jgi:hypothetical protein